MPKKIYIHRSIEGEIRQRANEFPVIALTGPRQTGKSTLLRKNFPRHEYVSLDEPFTRKLAVEDPDTFFENHPAPVLIDEIQYAPSLLPYMKILVDRKREDNGAFILTGSQLFPLMQGISESLAGRVALFELLGFSLEELAVKKAFLNFGGCFSLLFSGFFPEVCVHRADPNSFFNSYVQTYLERDVRQVKAVHDLVVFQGFLELLAARCGNLLNLNEIAKEAGVSATTIKHWMSVLEVSRMVYLLRPYAINITKRVVKAPKLYFTDTGLLSYILRYPTPETLSRGPLSGAFFENFIIMEVLKNKFNFNKRFELYFYRDSNHNEADLVLDFGFKKIVVEIKQAKTLRREHWNHLPGVAAVVGAEEMAVISNYPEKMRLDKNIIGLPWWRTTELLQ